MMTQIGEPTQRSMSSNGSNCEAILKCLVVSKAIACLAADLKANRSPVHVICQSRVPRLTDTGTPVLAAGTMEVYLGEHRRHLMASNRPVHCKRARWAIHGYPEGLANRAESFEMDRHVTASSCILRCSNHQGSTILETATPSCGRSSSCTANRGR